jgi:myo-inositol-1(or 4)-monophosphatase
MIERSELAQQAAIIAGEIIRSSHPQAGSVSKEGRLNFVTAADLASEKAIIDHIRKEFPDDAILSEETNAELDDPLSVSRLWVIDPIDGTNNFRRQRDYSGVSIGYVEHGETILGAIYNPFRDELFTAQKGKGAFLNGERIYTAQEKELANTEIASDNWYDPAGTRQNLEIIMKLNPVPFIFMKGSAVLLFSEIACGRMDLYFHNFLKPWDNSAGFLLVREAGGVVKDFKGDDVNFLSPQAVAGNTHIVDQFLNKIK